MLAGECAGLVVLESHGALLLADTHTHYGEMCVDVCICVHAGMQICVYISVLHYESVEHNCSQTYFFTHFVETYFLHTKSSIL